MSILGSLKSKKSINQGFLRDQRQDVVSFHYQDKSKVKEFNQVFVWDLDKTYLDTHFESFRGIIRIIFEKAFQKRNVPGSAALVRALAKQFDPLPIFFVSATPPQMHDKIKEKWRLDGISPFGFFSKDNLANLRPGRWGRLTKHVGFKIQALMELRLLMAEESKMICWGDDSESDAVIYSLFSDICAHRMTDREVRELLRAYSVIDDQIDLIIELRDQRENWDPVSRVYINLAVDTDPEYYRRYGRRLLAVENTFEIAVDLFQRDFLTCDQVIEIGHDLQNNYSFKKFEIEDSYTLLCKRRRVGVVADEELRPKLIDAGLIESGYDPGINLEPLESLPLKGDFESISRPWIPERISYLSDY